MPGKLAWLTWLPVLGIRITLMQIRMRIRILPFTLMRTVSVPSLEIKAQALEQVPLQIGADQFPAYHLEADPDTAYHFDADPDPDPTFPFEVDPDPQHSVAVYV